MLVFLLTFPVVIPFMLNQRREIGVAGLKCGRCDDVVSVRLRIWALYRDSPLAVGISMVAVGIVLVGIAIALDG